MLSARSATDEGERSPDSQALPRDETRQAPPRHPPVTWKRPLPANAPGKFEISNQMVGNRRREFTRSPR